MKRKINITIEIDDNDYTEFKLRESLIALLGKSMIDYRVFPNTKHLKENEAFNKLVKAKKKAGLELDRFINNNRCCKSDSEQLSKRPNTTSTWECFNKVDKQNKGNY